MVAKEGPVHFAPNAIVVHCSATQDGKEFPASWIKTDHISNRGFQDIGYHYVIQPSGDVQAGRSVTEPGAHCPEMNKRSLAVCLVGHTKYTLEQMDALYTLVEALTEKIGCNKSQVYCHHQFESARRQGKTCPGIEINELLGWLIFRNKEQIKRVLL